MNRAVFFDRDGVIIKEKHFISNPDDVELHENAGLAIKLLNQHEYYTIVVSNQSGIARGYFSINDYNQVTTRMCELLEEDEGHLDLILFSPYHKNGIIKEYSIDSPCRKPGSGMFLKAKNQFSLDFSNCWLIGDKATDILAGKRLGIKTILVKTGYGEENEKPDYICKDIYESVLLILDKDKL